MGGVCGEERGGVDARQFARPLTPVGVRRPRSGWGEGFRPGSALLISSELPINAGVQVSIQADFH